MTEKFILTLSCKEQIGVVASIATALAANDAFIVESEHYGDDETAHFFMRTVFRPTSVSVRSLQEFRASIAPVAQRMGIQFSINCAHQKMKVILLVSKHGHCLNHLLHNWQTGDLPIEIVGVISNHEDMRCMVEWYKLPFHYIPNVPGNKPAQEARILEAINASGAELTVLARYMQILSDDLTRKLEGRCINIHHSFLPSFKGAKPYHQAHARGVKVVGATAHFVTADLDEGPIIEQETARVDHSLSADEFVRLGKDIENMVITRAVRWYAERRLQLNGAKTVVFKGAA